MSHFSLSYTGECYLPYKCNQYSTAVILPKEMNGVLDIEKKLDTDYLKGVNQISSSRFVELSLPKLRIAMELDAKEPIANMGSSLMFSDRADFSGISKSDSLQIDRVIYKTFVETDERKTEVATLTLVDKVIIGYASPEPPLVFKADHSFVFLIIDNRTKAVYSRADL